MTAPVLNTYKVSFTLKRLLQTFIGGPRFIPPPDSDINAIIVSILLSMLLFLLPLGFGETFTAAFINSSGGSLMAGLVTGIAQAIFTLTIQIPFILPSSTYQKHQNLPSYSQRATATFSATQDEDLEPLSLDDMSSLWRFVVSPTLSKGEGKGRWKGVVVAFKLLVLAVWSGAIVGGACAFLQLGNVQRVPNFTDSSTSMAIHIFGWLSVCNSIWSITCSPPPESNTYEGEDDLQFDRLTRSFYIGLLLILAALLAHVLLCGGTPTLTVPRLLIQVTFSALGPGITYAMIQSSSPTSIWPTFGFLIAIVGCLASSRLWFNILVTILLPSPHPTSKQPATLEPQAAHPTRFQHLISHLRNDLPGLILRIAIAFSTVLVPAMQINSSQSISSMTSTSHTITAALTFGYISLRRITTAGLPASFPIITNPIRISSKGNMNMSRQSQNGESVIKIFIGIISVIIHFGLPLSTAANIVAAMLYANSDREKPYGPHPDSSLYKQLIPSLSTSLTSTASPIYLQPISLFPTTPPPLLIKLDLRMILIRPTEVWYEGCGVVATGLEMKGTSCHTVESVVVEEILEEMDTAHGKGDRLAKWVYPGRMNVLESLGRVHVKSYSDASSSVTGILDHPDTLDQLPALFIKCLVYVSRRQLSNIKQNLRLQSLPVNEDSLKNVWKQFPIRWNDMLKMRERNVMVESGYGRFVGGGDDELLMTAVTLGCTATLGINFMGTPPRLMLQSLLRIYRGEISESTPPDLRQWFFAPQQRILRETSLVAWRYAVKLLWESVVEASDVEDLDYLAVSQTLGPRVTDLTYDYANHTIIPNRLPINATWNTAVERNTPHIFTLGDVRADEDPTINTNTQDRDRDRDRYMNSSTPSGGGRGFGNTGFDWGPNSRGGVSQGGYGYGDESMARGGSRILARVMHLSDQNSCEIGRLNNELIR
ncbi:Pecanex-like protein 4, partial [Blyttiomyces sp. JEL0837]